MAFKYYAALQASDGTKTLPRAMSLHNPNSADITLELTPASAGLIFYPFTGSADVLSSIVTLPNLRAAQAATDYDLVTVTGYGSGADITVTTTNVGSDLGDFAAGHTSGAYFAGNGIPFGDGVQTYEPETDGSGTGFKVKFAVTGTAQSQTITNLEVIAAGTGYAAGDVLTFTAADEGTFTRTLTAADITDVFNPTTAVIKSTETGENYQDGDLLQFTMSEDITVGEVTTTYTYVVQLRVAQADLAGSTFNYVLGSGVTTPFQASKFKVLGTDDRAVTAID